ncbi:arylsulfatase [Bacteroidota bacterium]
MKTNSIKLFLFLFASITLMLHGCSVDKRERVRPNFILIITDDQGYGDLGFHGNPDIKTPFLDSLADMSTRFTQFYVSPVCAPTRAALMTGRYALRTGIYDVYPGGTIMHTSERTIAEILKENGYRTGIFGKWHLGDNYPFRPVDQGFDESLVHKGGGIGQEGDHIQNFLRTDSCYFDPVLMKNGMPEKFSGYCSDIFTDAALDFLDENTRNKETPFFLYLSYNTPHTPLQVPKEYYDRYKELVIKPENYPFPENFPTMNAADLEAAKRVYAMVTNIDDNVSKLYRKLKESDVYENTLLIFMTDNGPQQYRYNGGFRRKKGSVYEGGTRVPFYIHWKNKFTGKLEISTPAAHIDILPTLLDICGIAINPGMKFDGKSLLPLLEGTKEWEERILINEWSQGFIQPYQNISVRWGKYKLVGNSEYTEGRSALELYNITEDPSEMNDISDIHTEIVNELADKFDEWYEEVIYSEALVSPPRIILGSEFENPVVLSRDNWKGAKIKPILSMDAMGYWDISFARDGMYDASLIYTNKIPSGGLVNIRAGTTQRNLRVANADSGILKLKNVPFKKGDFMLEAWYESGGQVYSPMYVEVYAHPE